MHVRRGACAETPQRSGASGTSPALQRSGAPETSPALQIARAPRCSYWSLARERARDLRILRHKQQREFRPHSRKNNDPNPEKIKTESRRMILVGTDAETRITAWFHLYRKILYCVEKQSTAQAKLILLQSAKSRTNLCGAQENSLRSRLLSTDWHFKPVSLQPCVAHPLTVV